MAPSERPLRVLYYEYPGSGVGGSRVSLKNLLLGLADHVHAFVVADLPDEVAAGLPATSRVIPAPRSWAAAQDPSLGRWGKTVRWWRYALGAAFDLACLIRRERIEVVHGNNEVTSNAPAVLAAMLTRRPYVSHLRGTEPPMRETRWLFRYVDHYIAISEHVLDFYVQEGVVSRQAASVIYNGIDVADLIQRSDDARVSRPGHLRVGMFARMIEYKGHAYFLEAARHIADRLPKAHFTVHGPLPHPADPDVSYYESVLRQCREKGLTDQVVFAGPYSDVVAVMGQTDVVLCCSPYDNFGRIFFEVMACGVPVVAFDCGGVREVAVPEENCLLVSNRDTVAMAEAVIRLATNPALRDKLSRGGHKTAASLFDHRINAQRVLSIYRDLLTPHAHSNGAS